MKLYKIVQTEVHDAYFEIEATSLDEAFETIEYGEVDPVRTEFIKIDEDSTPRFIAAVPLDRDP